MFSSTLRKLSRQLGVLPRALSLIFFAAPRWIVVFALVWLTRPLVDRLACAVRFGANWPVFRPIVMPAALIAGGMYAQSWQEQTSSQTVASAK
jgi:hypothetical protein